MKLIFNALGSIIITDDNDAPLLQLPYEEARELYILLGTVCGKESNKNTSEK